MPTVALASSTATMSLSTADGYAFITSSSLNFATYLNKYITVSDGTNSVSGYIKAQGSGETLGSELVTTWVNGGNGGIASYTTFTLSGSNITSAVEATSKNTYASRNLGTLSGSLLKAIVSTYIQVSGTATTFLVACDQWSDYTGAAKSGGIYSSLIWYTTQGIYSYAGVRNISGNANWSANGFSIKQVLTPSASGVTITNTRGGNTYNWISNSGINPNAASFTVTISP